MEPYQVQKEPGGVSRIVGPGFTEGYARIEDESGKLRQIAKAMNFAFFQGIQHEREARASQAVPVGR